MATIVVVDDLRSFRPHVLEQLDSDDVLIYLRSEKEALQFLAESQKKRGHIDQIFLDHDLWVDENGVPTDSKSICYFLRAVHHDEEYPKVDQIFIHTSNPPARSAMEAILNCYDHLQVITRPEDYFVVS